MNNPPPDSICGSCQQPLDDSYELKPMNPILSDDGLTYHEGGLIVCAPCYKLLVGVV